MYFWGWIFIATTTLVAILKHEVAEKSNKTEQLNLSVKKAYVLLWDTINLPNMKSMTLFLLTVKVCHLNIFIIFNGKIYLIRLNELILLLQIGFSACDAVTGLKLVEGGIPKEKFALMAVPMIPLQIILPIFVSKYTAGPRPMDVFMTVIPYRYF